MIRHLLVLLTIFALFVTLSTAAFSQGYSKDAKEKPAQMKSEAKAEMKEIKSVTCDPACGFSMMSHDEAELIDMTKIHAKKHHNMDMSDKDVKGMIKTVSLTHKEMDKTEKKKEGKPDG